MNSAHRLAVGSLRLLGVLLCLLLVQSELGSALAQDTLASSPPLYSAVDPQNVDLGTGAFTIPGPVLTIGQPGAGGLSYSRMFIGTGWRDNVMGGINYDGATYRVSIGTASESFTQSGSAYINAGGSASTLTYDSGAGIYTYTMADGSVAKFSLSLCCRVGSINEGGKSNLGPASAGRITSMTLPSGEVRTWNYAQGNFCVKAVGGGCYTYTQFGRLQSVTNNFGYQIRFVYASNDTSDANQIAPWITLTQVVGLNMATDSCAPLANACTYSQTWPSISFATPGDNANARTATDALNRVTRYTYSGSSGNNLMTAVRRPSSGSDNVTVTYDGSARVSSVSNGAGTWSYGYGDSGNVRTTTVTDPWAITGG